MFRILVGDPGGFQQKVDSISIGSEETSRLVESQAHHYRDVEIMNIVEIIREEGLE